MSERIKSIDGYKEFDEVACRKCRRGVAGGAGWKILTNGKGQFKAKCKYCGHLSNFEIVDKPDPKADAISLRFFL